MSDYLLKIIYLTKALYNTLQGGGTIGSLTGLNSNYLYCTTDENITTDDLGDLIVPVSKGGTGKTSFTVGSLLVGNSDNALTEIAATNSNTANTVVKRDASGNFSAGTITAALSGNATTSSYPYGFSSRATSATWGSTDSNIGTFLTGWLSSSSGAIAFMNNNPSSGKLSIKIDGRYYFNEGATPAAGLRSANNYWGMTGPDGQDNIWIRTTSQGIIPYQSGGASAGHGLLGTDTWYFSKAYVQDIYGTLNGNASTASKLTTSNLGSATKPIYLVAGVATECTELKDLAYINKPSSNGTTTYLRGDGSWISLSDMGLSNALHFIGTTSTQLTDGATTSTLTAASTNSLSKTTGFVAGDVVIYSDYEFVWLGSAWEKLGDDSSFKVKLTAITDSTGTSESTTATRFVYSVSQNELGVISVKTRPLPTYSNYTHPTGDGNQHVPANGTDNDGKFLKATSTAGTYEWSALPTASTSAAGIIQIGTGATNAMAGNTNVNNVFQGTTTTSNWRKVLSSGNDYAAWNTAVGNDANTVTYRTASVAIQPSTGTLRATVLRGGAITLTSGSIQYEGTKATNTVIQFLDNTVDTYGNGIKIGAGGLVVVGAGESASNLSVTNNGTIKPGTETLFLLSDGVINAEAHADTIGNRIGFLITANGHIIPIKAEAANNNELNIGASDNKWANIYATTFNGDLTGNAATATILETARAITLDGEISGTANFDGSDNITITTTSNTIITIQKTLTVTDEWQDTGILYDDLATGTYIILMSGFNSGYIGLWGEIYSGILTWYASETNSGEYDDIWLHKAGHASNGRCIFLRTARHSRGNGNLKLEIKGSHSATSDTTITFKFRRMI